MAQESKAESEVVKQTTIADVRSALFRSFTLVSRLADSSSELRETLTTYLDRLRGIYTEFRARRGRLAISHLNELISQFPDAVAEAESLYLLFPIIRAMIHHVESMPSSMLMTISQMSVDESFLANYQARADRYMSEFLTIFGFSFDSVEIEDLSVFQRSSSFVLSFVTDDIGSLVVGRESLTYLTTATDNIRGSVVIGDYSRRDVVRSIDMGVRSLNRAIQNAEAAFEESPDQVRNLILVIQVVASMYNAVMANITAQSLARNIAAVAGRAIELGGLLGEPAQVQVEDQDQQDEEMVDDLMNQIYDASNDADLGDCPDCEDETEEN